jgi:acyl-coenzyme A synthetase/AMP-(fatty) acid ligase
MSSYKMPTLLYVAQYLAKTASGKVQKKLLRKNVFESGKYAADIQVYSSRKLAIRPRL